MTVKHKHCIRQALGIAVLSLAASLGPSSIHAQEAPKWAQEQLEKWYAAFNAGDASALMKLYAVDAVLFLPDQTLRGRAAIEAFQKENFQKTRYACTWVIDGVQALGKQAVVWGHDACTETPKAGGAPRTVKNRWLTVLEQQKDGSWIIVRDSGEEIKEVN